MHSSGPSCLKLLPLLEARKPPRISVGAVFELLTGVRLFVDETTVKVLAPGAGKVKTAYL